MQRMNRPSVKQLVHAARVARVTIGARSARYVFDGRIAIPLHGRWNLVISPDDAGRLRVDACQGLRPRATMWCLAGDDGRLVELASAAKAEAAALAV